jgi:hypothetical protein
MKAAVDVFQCSRAKLLTAVFLEALMIFADWYASRRETVCF